jgi:hypothetical protein
MDALIYDRLVTDVTARTAKGFWQLSDLTRIESWITYLAGLYGVTPLTTAHSAGQMVRLTNLLADLTVIREWHTFPADTERTATPAVPSEAAWNYVKANSVERILFDADLWYNNRIKLYKYCGTFSCGTDFAL